MAKLGEHYGVGPLSFMAGEDMGKGLGVVLTTTEGEVELPGAGDGIVGVTIQDVVAGKAVSIALYGQLEVVAGGEIVVGDSLTVAVTGKFVAGTTGDLVAGTALTAAAADNDTFIALIRPSATAVPE